MARKLCMGCMEYYDDRFDICPCCGYVDGTKANESYHLAPGTVIQGKYIVGKSIGYGGFGVTYIGYDPVLERKVAIKEYLPGEFATRSEGDTSVSVFTNEEKEEQFFNGIDKFVDEAKRLESLQGISGVVGVFDTFKENNTAYIVMEYLDGETLKEKLAREEKMDFADAMNYIVPILDALTEVHARGMLHRDISPDNIFVTKGGEVKLIDFGAARYATMTHSKSLSVIVKQGYAPQEQYRSRGDQGPWTDVYACAAVVYKMITGVTPEDSMERGKKDSLKKPAELGVKLPKNKHNALMNALNLKIEDRTQSTADFKEELLRNGPVKKRKVTLKAMDIGRWPLWVKITSGVAAAAVLIVGLLWAFGVISFKPGGPGIHGKNGVMVPMVVGSTVMEATNSIKAKELNVSIVDRQKSDDLPKNVVLSQTPGDGQYVETGSVIKMVISDGGEIIYLPDFVGMLKEDAASQIADFGINDVFYIDEESAIAKGRICSQSITEGTEVGKGDKLTLGVSKGMPGYSENNMTKVLDFVSRSWSESVDAAAAGHVYVYVLGSEYSSQIPKGQVMKQDAEAGSSVKEGTEIGLTISLGVKTVRVPDVTYKSKEEAEEIMQKAGLQIRFVDEDIEANNSIVMKDHVTRMEVESGTEVSEDTEITVYLSLGSPEQEDKSETENTTERKTETATQKKTETEITIGTEAPKPVFDPEMIVNKSEEEGKKIIASFGLKANRNVVENKDVSNGTITRASVNGNTVNYDVVENKKTDTTPTFDINSIIGLSEQDGLKKIKSAGLTAGSRSVSKTYGDKKDGTITSASKNGDSVDYAVVENFKTSMIIGEDEAKAKTVIAEYGLDGKKEDAKKTYGTSKDGTVYSATVSGNTVKYSLVENFKTSMIIGKNEATAKSVIKEYGLSVGTKSIKKTYGGPDSPDGAIYSAEIEGTKVNYSVIENFTVDMIIGLGEGKAKETIKEYGLSIGEKSLTKISGGYASGTVKSASMDGNTVNYTVVEGFSTNLIIGLSESEAKKVISEYGMTAGTRSVKKTYGTSANGTIYDASVSGNTVNYSVVENFDRSMILGKTEINALSTIKEYGLSPGTRTQIHNTSYSTGQICAASISGSTVNYSVTNNNKHTEYRYRTISSYDEKTTTTNSSPGNGYSLYDTKTTDTYGSWGSWSGWSQSAVSSSDTRQVESEGAIQLGRYRRSSDNAQEDHPFSGGELEERIFRYSEISKADPFQWSGSVTQRWMCDYWGVGWNSQCFYHNAQGIYWTWEGVMYRYRDRAKSTTTTYYWRKPIWSEWSPWSTTYVSGTSTKEVEQQQVYDY